tara:strand:+ start:642 stop:842 length:201 start_codon:yes stop_codon:yes gene_type:complete
MKLINMMLICLLLVGCAGGNVAKIKFGKRCSSADAKGNFQASYVWFISKEALNQFDNRINKKNCDS